MSWLKQQNADMDDPKQHVLWALCGMPIDAGGTQIALPMHSAAFVSEFLHEIGFRHHPELQTLYRRPDDTVSESAPLGVEWLECEPGKVPDVAPDSLAGGVSLDGMTDEEIAVLQAAIDARRGGAS